MMKPGRLIEELRTLATLLGSASASVNVIADELQQVGLLAGFGDEPEEDEDEPSAERRDDDDDDADEAPPWDELVARAEALLREAPSRVWKPAELVRAARDAGVHLSTLQGVHFGLMPRLRERGAIEEAAGGFRAASASPGAPPLPPARVEVEEAPKARRELPWGDIVPTAMRLLREAPLRRWGPAELARAVRDAGVAIDNLQGIHFGLVSRLEGQGAVSIDSEGKLRLSELLSGNGEAAPSAEPGGPHEEDALTEEIDACEMFLARQTSKQRTSQVALWAGRARELQERWNSGAEPGEARRASLRRVFGRLTRIAREQQCEWIDALTPDWTMPWGPYIAWHTAQLTGEPLELSDEARRALYGGLLRGLLLASRKSVPADDVVELLADALEVLPADDPDVRAVEARFGRVRRAVQPLVRRASSAVPKPAEPGPSAPAPVEKPNIDEPVLAVTRGRRAVIVGGTGAHEPQRQALQDAFGFSALDWAWLERGAHGQLDRTEERIKQGGYDVVLFLAGYTGHGSVPLLRACKSVGVPLVYLPRGYGATQVANSIEEQLVPRAAPGA